MKRADLAFGALLVPLDYLALITAATVAYSLRFAPFFTWLKPVQFALTYGEYMKAVVPVAFVYLLVFAASGLYTLRPRGGIFSEMVRVGMAASAGMAAVLAIAFFSRELFDSRFIILAAWAASIVFVAGARLIVRLVQKSLRTLGIDITRVIVIGKTKTANTLSDTLKEHPAWGYRVVQHLAAFNEDVAKKITQMQRDGRVDAILLANPDATRREIVAMKAFADNEHLTFLYSADIFAGSTLRPIVHTFGDSPVIEVPKTPLDGWGAIYKRLFDIIGSIFLIVLTLPVQIIAAIAITTTSKGGMLFSRLPGGKKVMRIGQYGRPFHYIKFRSMYQDRHFERYNELAHLNTRAGALVKTINDPRVTPVGKFIRKFSIDELPEFYLVLFGKMSLVGPRPHYPEEVDNYKPHQRRVLTIKPGITGMAQVSGRANLDFDDEVKLDMHYIENWSPWLDIIILLKTPFAVLFHKGLG